MATLSQPCDNLVIFYMGRVEVAERWWGWGKGGREGESILHMHA